MTREQTRDIPGRDAGATAPTSCAPHRVSRGDFHELGRYVDQAGFGRPDRSSGGLRRHRGREAALRRGRRRAAGRSAARLPGVLVRLAAADRAARGSGLPRRRARPAGIQPVVQAGRRRRLRRRRAGRRRPRSHPGARRRVRARGRPRLGWNRRLDARDEPPRGRRPAGHPQRGASAQAQ